MNPKFEPTQEGIEIIDPIERHRYRLTTNEPVSLESADADQIGFPVGSVTRFRADSITLPKTETVLVRDSDGLMLAEVSPAEQKVLQPGEYTIDLSGPLKVYVQVDSSIRIFSDNERTYVTFGDETSVVLGARSFHKRPAGTITTTANPTDLMEAVSAFGSALKTTMTERSYPTLRGHPPRLELGEERHVPAKFDRPDHGVRIEVPATLRHVFVVTPLAYYLGATVGPGSNPRIVTDEGYTYALDEPDEFESSVAKTLKQVFFLDCVVRTEGKTPLPLHERQSIEPLLDFDVADVYDQPLAKRIERYLEGPPPDLESHLPSWQFETRLEPTADRIEFLPFLANDLAVIRTEQTASEPTLSESVAERAIEEFTRGDFVRSARSDSLRGSKTVTASADSPQVPTIQQSWTGIDESDIISTMPLGAYQNNIGRTPKDGPIEIEVVCNDAEMRPELESVDGTYGTREELPFDTTIHYDLTRDGLEEVLARSSDFLHYIGHIDGGGFQCSDGKLNAETVDTVGSKAFLLNACQSHEQGLHLIENGSVGGIVTFGDIVNSGAVTVGTLIAQLLNLGFPLYGALDVVRQENIIGQQYRMVGNGETTITQSETGVPNLCSLSNDGENRTIDIEMYNSSNVRRGGVFSPYVDSIESYYVIPRRTGPVSVTESELNEFFDEALFPVIQDDRIQWSKELLTE